VIVVIHFFLGLLHEPSHARRRHHSQVNMGVWHGAWCEKWYNMVWYGMLFPMSHAVHPCRTLWRCTEGRCTEGRARREPPRNLPPRDLPRDLLRDLLPRDLPRDLPRRIEGGLEEPPIPSLPALPPMGSLPYPTGWVYRGVDGGVMGDVLRGVVGGDVGGVISDGNGRTWERCVHGRLCSMSDVVVNVEGVCGVDAGIDVGGGSGGVVVCCVYCIVLYR
jgi:hypothetical protein